MTKINTYPGGIIDPGGIYYNRVPIVTPTAVRHNL